VKPAAKPGGKSWERLRETIMGPYRAQYGCVLSRARNKIESTAVQSATQLNYCLRAP
jgi:hypothetical protein